MKSSCYTSPTSPDKAQSVKLNSLTSNPFRPYFPHPNFNALLVTFRSSTVMKVTSNSLGLNLGTLLSVPRIHEI